MMGTRRLTLTGEGEPFLHPEILKMISTVKAARFHLTVLTNGTLLDEESVQSLIDSRLDVVNVSLWASSPEKYEKSYPGTEPHNFEKVVNGLKLVSYHKAKKNSELPRVVLHQPVTRYNYQEIEALVDLAHVTGCNSISFSPLKYSKRGLASYALPSEEEEHLFQDMRRMKKKLKALSIDHNIDQTILRYRIGPVVWEKVPCYISWIHVRIKSDGTVLPCNQPCNISLGNLNEKGFDTIWNGPLVRWFRRNTISVEGFASIENNCDCSFCCHMNDNLRIHRFFRWPSIFLGCFRK
jgi:MoaA/NifB/PqqE/SkfB family radical SAM enzyme